jgi:uncharacterized cupredoxin-like copper-binding protein
MMLRQLGLGAVAVTTVAAIACGGGGSSAASKTSTGGGAAAAPQALTVKGTDTRRFEPATLSAKAYTPVRVTLDDTGDALIHDFVIDNAGGKPFKLEAQPNGKVTGDFTVPAGTYSFYCSQPGHTEAGMVGTLTVS